MKSPISAESLLNQKLDMLLVKSIEGRDTSGSVIYKCSCECGEEVIRAKPSLISKAFKSCGCTRKNNGKTKGKVFKVLETGSKFGELTILSLVDDKNLRCQHYNTLCSCGGERVYEKYRITTGKVKSCGCKQRNGGGRPPLKDLVGLVFGKLSVLYLDPSKERSSKTSQNYYMCKCECGRVVSSPAASLMYGGKDCCGCDRLILSRKLRKNGYMELTGIPKDDPYNTSGGCRMAEHRYVMAKIIGRALLDNENVHHINGIRSDNRPENLELWVKSQPPGQRVEDIISYAKQLLMIYSPESLAT